MNPLLTSSILLHLELCKWAGEVKDKRALAIVAKQTKGDVHRDRYVKSLFVDDPLAAINLCAGRLRNHFYDSTLAWLDGGKGRLIPSMQFEEFADKHAELKADFNREVQKFIEGYEDHKELAKKHKGDLFNEAEYPPVEEVRERFEVTLHALPFPDVEDFRIDAPDEVIEELKSNMQESLNHVQGVVTRELEMRLEKRLGMLLKTLKVGKRFNTSLLTELQSVVDMGAHLQEAISKDLYGKLVRVEQDILKWEPDQIRNSQSLQDDLIVLCQELL